MCYVTTGLMVKAHVWADRPPCCSRASSCLTLITTATDREEEREGVTAKSGWWVCNKRGEDLGVDWRVEVRLIENCNGPKKKRQAFSPNYQYFYFFLILCPFCSCTMLSSLAMLFLCLHQTVWGQQQTGEPHLFSIHYPSSLPPNSADRWMFLAASPHFCSSLTSCSRLKAPILSCFTTLSHHVAACLCNLRHQQATKNSAGFSEWQQIDVFCTFFLVFKGQSEWPSLQ